MKPRIRYFVAAVAALAVFASGALVSEAMMKNQKELVRAAKKEGAVTIINPLFSDRTAKRMGLPSPSTTASATASSSATCAKAPAPPSPRFARRCGPRSSPSTFTW